LTPKAKGSPNIPSFTPDNHISKSICCCACCVARLAFSNPAANSDALEGRRSGLFATTGALSFLSSSNFGHRNVVSHTRHFIFFPASFGASLYVCPQFEQEHGILVNVFPFSFAFALLLGERICDMVFALSRT
jgi:hypothetical protein